MLTVEEALERVLVDVPRLPAEQVPLQQAFGRILAEDIHSPRDVPPWDNSAMDGYAVHAADTGEGEVVLRLNEVIAAGSMPDVAVQPGTASAIMTGAPMPEGADAVVMVEKTDGAQEGAVRIYGRASVGQHIRPKGGDVAAGDLVLEAGRVLGPAHVGLVASLGIPSLLVVRRPVVAILSTGDEVVMPGRPLEPGQIYSSNNFTLTGLVQQAGGIPLDAGNAPDDLEALLARLDYALQEADVVLTTGGVSMGSYDLVRDAFAELGVAMDFWKVAMKPGKPLAFGRAERNHGTVPLFGLPGNPVSCMVNFLQFVRPWMRMAMGAKQPFLPVIEAVLDEDVSEGGGRVHLVRVRLEQGPEGFVARSTGSQSSGVLTSMARANGLLLIGSDRGQLHAGERVRVQLLDTAFLDRKEPGYGW